MNASEFYDRATELLDIRQRIDAAVELKDQAERTCDRLEKRLIEVERSLIACLRAIGSANLIEINGHVLWWDSFDDEINVGKLRHWTAVPTVEETDSQDGIDDDDDKDIDDKDIDEAAMHAAIAEAFVLPGVDDFVIQEHES